MLTLRIDLETYSSVDLKKDGLARYVASADFQIMLFAYKTAIPERGIKSETACVDLLVGEKLPRSVLDMLTDPGVKKTAFNAAFEIACIERQYGIKLPLEQWECTMVHALYCGLPGGLAEVGKVLKVKNQKDFRGSSLIRTFCVPCKATKKNGMRTRNLPEHDPDRWALFKQYNILDVECEDEVADRLAKVPMPAIEWEYWRMDQEMNERGVRVDLPLVKNAIEFEGQIKEKLTAEAVVLTGLRNVNSVKQLKTWLTSELLYDVTTLNKTSIPKLEGMAALQDNDAARVIELRQQLGKSSISKYHAMARAADAHGVVRGLTQFYGANRTGRAAGRLVQLQNLRKNGMPSEGFDQLTLARDLLRQERYDTIEMLWDDPLDILSQLVRTALIPDEGHIFAPVDFSAIEARMLAWVAGEAWRLEVFKTHGKIYEASAAKMFGIPMAQITKAHPARAKGKVAELALGYQGGEGALIRMGALEMGLKTEELDPIKWAWRAANQAIAGQSYRGEAPGFWEKMDEAAKDAIRLGGEHHVEHGITFRKDKGILFMRLPSGRDLCYLKPSIEEGDYGPEVHFWGQNQITKQWEEQKSYGGRWTENYCQASCRDLLYAKLLRMKQEGLHKFVKFHVHDEAVPSVPLAQGPTLLKDIEAIFAEPVPWAPGLPLRGDGFLTPFFRKDD